MSESHAVLLSIRSEHARAIYAGEKRAELRKSFTASGGGIVFLYETAPIAAVTGGFFVDEVIRLPVAEAINRASEFGIERTRAERYYERSSHGWVISVARPFTFQQPFSLEKMRERNHRFMVPQGFAYVTPGDSLGSELIQRMRASIKGEIVIKRIRKKNISEFRELVFESVATAYEDIDDDFVNEVVFPDRSIKAAFSTEKKLLYELNLGKVTLGYTVLSVKKFGAVKTGPTLLRDSYRGLGIGVDVRMAILKSCKALGYRKLYCTCPSNRPHVILYLLRAGMRLEAVLSHHLHRDRDEYVLGTLLRSAPAASISVSKVTSNRGTVRNLVEVGQSHKMWKSVSPFLQKWSSAWYYSFNSTDAESLMQGIINHAGGIRSFSAKPRRIFGMQEGARRLVCLLVLTEKRSGMAKLNLFSSFDSFDEILSLLKWALSRAQYRRYYVTLPVDKCKAILAFLQMGFRVEGRLEQPFENVDHVALGKNA
ncbi:MAG: hypothetical protein SFU53_04005 [Terrimicrobiaceae bacterium]|nr:hypothetical protein [Terrimicrobiaceae bacterium]